MPKRPVFNIFLRPSVAEEYDNYYLNEQGRNIDKIEKKIIEEHIKLLKLLPKDNLLELGCGTGHWTNFFTGMGFQVTAVDESEAMLNIAVAKNIKNASFMLADASELPFPDKSFDIIASVTMLEFVEDPVKILDEVYRVLKPMGSLVLGCLNKNSIPGKNKDDDPVFKYADFFSPKEIEDMLSGFGTPYLTYGVYITEKSELSDGTDIQSRVEPVFIAASVKKTK